MEALANNFWAWWIVVVVWMGILMWIGVVVENSTIVAKAVTVILLALFAGLVFGTAQWLHYMQVWPFIPQ